MLHIPTCIIFNKYKNKKVFLKNVKIAVKRFLLHFIYKQENYVYDYKLYVLFSISG